MALPGTESAKRGKETKKGGKRDSTYSKCYRAAFLWAQCTAWFKQTVYDPTASLSAERRGILSLPDIETAYGGVSALYQDHCSYELIWHIFISAWSSFCMQYCALQQWISLHRLPAAGLHISKSNIWCHQWVSCLGVNLQQGRSLQRICDLSIATNHLWPTVFIPRLHTFS